MVSRDIVSISPDTNAPTSSGTSQHSSMSTEQVNISTHCQTIKLEVDHSMDAAELWSDHATNQGT